jgi:hypothetical protein
VTSERSRPWRFSRLALLALLAWAAFACALELHRSEWLLRHDPFPEERPSTWRITSRPVARMARFAFFAAKALPPGSRVAVAAGPGLEGERLYRYLWLIYFLPGVETRLAAAPSPSSPTSPISPEPPVDFWISYGARLDGPGLAPILITPDGAVYRVVR